LQMPTAKLALNMADKSTGYFLDPTEPPIPMGTPACSLMTN
jgi:hypothetical protein